MWLVLMSLRLRGLLVGSWPCRVFQRTRPAVVRLRMAGVARVCVASGWALRGGTCRPGCALVGVATCTNGLGMALLSPSMCRSSRERRGRCLMDMDRCAILLILHVNLICPLMQWLGRHVPSKSLDLEGTAAQSLPNPDVTGSDAFQVLI